MGRITKLLAVLAVILMAFAPLFAGGGAEEADGDGYQFSFATGRWDIAMGRIDVADQPANPYFQYVLEQTGVGALTQSWEWANDGYVEGLRLALAGGEQFDAINPFSPALAQEVIDGGLALPLTDLIPNYPNVYALYTPEEWDFIAANQGGEIYFIPQRAPFVTVRAGLIRQDWLDNVGLDVPTTQDELVAVYRAFLAQDANGNGDPNDEIPVSGRSGFRWFDDLFAMFGSPRHDGFPMWSWNEDLGIFESAQVSQATFEAVKFINSLYEEGLMEAEMLTNDNPIWTGKIGDDRVGHYFHLVNEVVGKSAFAYGPGGDDTGLSHWAVLPNPPVVPGVGQQQYTFPQIQGPTFMILRNAEQPEKIMEWLNWGASEEGTLFRILGIPGTDWDRAADGSINIINELEPSFRYAFGAGGDAPDELIALQPMGELKVQMMDQLRGNVANNLSLQIPGSVYEDNTDFNPFVSVLYRATIPAMISVQIEPTQANWDAYVDEWYSTGGQEVTDKATEWYKSVTGR